jgi:glutathione S-transferase
MTEPQALVLVGRSSSHFTRTTRIFARELGLAYEFRPVYDMTALEVGTYADNPALKVPVLIDEQGPLYGTENICRELTRRSGRRDRVILRGDVADRVVANAEELALHAMGTAVVVITGQLGDKGFVTPAKMQRSLENALSFLDQHVERACAALPPDRILSFLETAVFCLVRHLPFRKVLDVSGYANLARFCAAFGTRAGARETEYRFDVPPTQG